MAVSESARDWHVLGHTGSISIVFTLSGRSSGVDTLKAINDASIAQFKRREDFTLMLRRGLHTVLRHAPPDKPERICSMHPREQYPFLLLQLALMSCRLFSRRCRR